MTLAGAFMLGGSAAVATKNLDLLTSTIGAGVGCSTVVIAFGGLAALLRAVRPGLGMLLLAPVLWGAVVGILAETLRLPGWAQDLSVLSWIGKVPVEPVDVPAATALGVAGLIALVCSAEVFVRRDMVAG